MLQLVEEVRKFILNKHFQTSAVHSHLMNIKVKGGARAHYLFPIRRSQNCRGSGGEGAGGKGPQFPRIRDLISAKAARCAGERVAPPPTTI